ncbi:D-lyxose/D-mannose family sugar isomerase [Paenibacillus thalictri]|uniref:D-lyxose/D-mannose family sugar isomerase n=1 Tax=Paenibacillus thalictri TaxID=2527873 RepID=A0A4Q9DNT0_9BACL|nr:D-lyxose/D-mannose family sugar isomerase [Paenibacillus thalictri]TBL75252.1 D-lyxose/D-mannose family sugar isomerase [Paenibacillus thalictri]
MAAGISLEEAREQALVLLEKANVALSEEDKAHLKVVDYGLKDIARYGVQFVEYINNERYCARQLALLPLQTIPEHMHPPVGDDPGKLETFRVVWGKVRVHTEFQEIELHAGEQYTIGGNVYHGFQAGEAGAVVIEFSSPARDRFDVFSNPQVQLKQE